MVEDPQGRLKAVHITLEDGSDVPVAAVDREESPVIFHLRAPKPKRTATSEAYPMDLIASRVADRLLTTGVQLKPLPATSCTVSEHSGHITINNYTLPLALYQTFSPQQLQLLHPVVSFS